MNVPALTPPPEFEVRFPTLRLAFVGLYLCSWCRGREIDPDAPPPPKARFLRPREPVATAPRPLCPQCGGEGAYVGRGDEATALTVDVWGRCWVPVRKSYLTVLQDPRGQLAALEVVARLRHPWAGRDAWETMPVVRVTEDHAWGPEALRFGVLRAATAAARHPDAGMAPDAEARVVVGATFESPLVWPENWPRANVAPLYDFLEPYGVNARLLHAAHRDWPNPDDVIVIWPPEHTHIEPAAAEDVYRDPNPAP